MGPRNYGVFPLYDLSIFRLQSSLFIRLFVLHFIFYNKTILHFTLYKHDITEELAARDRQFKDYLTGSLWQKQTWLLNLTCYLRPPVLWDHFVLAEWTVSHIRFHCTAYTAKILNSNHGNIRQRHFNTSLLNMDEHEEPFQYKINGYKSTWNMNWSQS